MSTATIPLGPFGLIRRIGRGGMAEVWSGVHITQAVPVAVKVMTGERLRDAQYREAFRNEVQAVASLDHPGIVMVLDHGEVSAESEAASQGLLPLGSPYLAMELADNGTLLDAAGEVADWIALRSILFSLLDALAHAHALGVVHRDLKPSNVLLFGSGADRQLKLADFGLAQAVEAIQVLPDSSDFVCGTPSYMAPEQIRGEWRDYGAWTDLYGLGSLAWMIATGKPPFYDAGLLELVRRQLTEEPPNLEPLFPVPAGFEGWLRRLLEKEPGHRFVRAADAAWSLRGLGSVSAPRPFVTTVGSDDDPTEVIAPEHMRAEESLTAAASGRPLALRVSPPLPLTWDRTASRPPSPLLLGAGLGLYGMRTIPLVGRRLERDILWGALSTVHARQEPRLVLLRGAAGTGKTRLATWIAERAHEVGGATVLRAIHGPTAGPADGLPRMLARHLRCVGLSRAELVERTARMLRLWKVDDEEELFAFADLMAPGTFASASANAADMPPARPQTSRERFELLERHLRRLSRQRPVILLLDDAPWGPESLAFARFLMELRDARPLAVLLLLTARDELLAERPAETAELAALLALPGTAAVQVPPLPPGDHTALIHELLGLSGDLAATVDERTDGNPLFAVQLVGDWVYRGLLEVGPQGFVLRPGVVVQLPDDLHEVWSGRVTRLVEGRLEGTREALEIAAALGASVDNYEWAETCKAAAVPCPPSLAESLVANRLAVRTQEGWDFVHAMLRESLERLAREAGRWPEHNRACAAMLAPRVAAGERGTAERLGRHLVLAGEQAAALEPLLRGARERRETGGYDLAQGLLNQRDEALAAIYAGPRDPRRGAGWVLRARIYLHQGRLDEVFRWAGQAVMGGIDGDWAAVRSESLRLLGDAARRRGDLDEAVRLYRRCTEVSVDPHGAAGSLWGLGDVARQRGLLAQAGELFAQSHTLYEEIGDVHGVADHWVGLADIARQKGDLDAAETLYKEAEARFSILGNQYCMARGRNGLGEVARMRGELGRAADFYRSSLALLTRLSSADDIFPRVNLALTALAGGDFLGALAALEESREILGTRGWGGLETVVRAALLPCQARTRAWKAWDEGFDAVSAALKTTGVVDPDILWAAALAAEVMAAAGEKRREAAARKLAKGSGLG